VATGICKQFGATMAVEEATVVVAPGQLVALLGPSGSGKTTLLRIIAGFEVPDAGSVLINGRAVAGTSWVEPERRRVGMVFQDGALFPHLTVAANVAFGEPAPGRVERCLELVGLSHRARSYPHELSGGERQRVALARALAPEPEVVLLDEPFASLDAVLRSSLREDVARILRQAGASALLVTHDQQEALSLADVVVVMREGRVEQVGAPEAVYAHPATRWVAEFLGAAEVLPGVAGDGSVDCELGRFPADPSLHGDVEIVVRPEALVIVAEAATDGADPVERHGDRPSDRPGVGPEARVLSRSYFGHDQLIDLELGSGRRVRSRAGGDTQWRAGQRVHLRVEGPVTVLDPAARP